MADRYGDGEGGHSAHRRDRGRSRRDDRSAQYREPDYDYSDGNDSYRDRRNRDYDRLNHRRYKQNDRRQGNEGSANKERRRKKGYNPQSRSYPQSPEKKSSYSPDYSDDDINDVTPRRLRSSDDWGMDYDSGPSRDRGQYKRDMSRKKSSKSPNRYYSYDSDESYDGYNRNVTGRGSGPYDNNIGDGFPEADYGYDDVGHYQDKTFATDKGKKKGKGKSSGLNRVQDGDRDGFTEDLPADYGLDSSSFDNNVAGAVTSINIPAADYAVVNRHRENEGGDQNKKLKENDNAADYAAVGTSGLALATKGSQQYAGQDNLAFELEEYNRQMGNSNSIEPYGSGGHYNQGEGHPSRLRGVDDDITSVTIEDYDDDALSTSSANERRIRPTTGLARRRLRRAGPLTEDEELLAVMGDGKAAARLREHQREQLKDRRNRKPDDKEDFARHFGDLYRQTIK